MIDLKLGENLDVFAQGRNCNAITIRVADSPAMQIGLDQARDLMVALGYAITQKEIDAAQIEATQQPAMETVS